MCTEPEPEQQSREDQVAAIHEGLCRAMYYVDSAAIALCQHKEAVVCINDLSQALGRIISARQEMEELYPHLSVPCEAHQSCLSWRNVVLASQTEKIEKSHSPGAEEQDKSR